MTNGIALALLAYATFSWGDACIKALGGRLSVFEIGLLVTVAAGAFLFFTCPPEERWRDFWKMKRPWLVHARALSGAGAGVLGVYAFTTIPLAEAYSLIFLSPFFVTLLSIAILKEQVGAWRWGAVLAGFAGVLLVVRPGFRELTSGHLAAVGIAFLAACTIILLRSLAGSEKRTSLLGVLLCYGVVLNGVVLLFTGITLPTPAEAALVVAGGGFTAMGQFFLIKATQVAPANQIAPTHYSQLAWAAVIGAALFGEVPDGLELVGLAVVTLAGLITLLRERRRLGRVRWNPFFRNRL